MIMNFNKKINNLFGTALVLVGILLLLLVWYIALLPVPKL